MILKHITIFSFFHAQSLNHSGSRDIREQHGNDGIFKDFCIETQNTKKQSQAMCLLHTTDETERLIEHQLFHQFNYTVQFTTYPMKTVFATRVSMCRRGRTEFERKELLEKTAQKTRCSPGL